jgi:phosphate transport system permease protein
MCALVSVLSVATITVFIFYSGIPGLTEIGFFKFITGTEWRPLYEGGSFGILPMILGSVYATLGAIVLGVPVGIFTAVMLSRLAPPPLKAILYPAVELLAGIPSVVYGFFGVMVIVPFVQKAFDLPMGQSLFSAIIILALMILPTVITISANAISSVPKEYTEASLALGATRMQTIFRVELHAARSGILSGVILGIGRAVGETMAVIMVAGNSPYMPEGLFSSIRTLTGNIAIEMGYAAGLHRSALFATGVVLFIFIMILNIVLMTLTKKGVMSDE